MSKPTKTPSQIITLFTQQSHEMELCQAKLKLDELAKEILERRNNILPKDAKQTVSQQSSQTEKFKTMDEHRVPIEELETRLQTSMQNGLTKDVATKKLQDIGRNLLTEKIKEPWYMKLIHELTGMFALLLWLGAILCFIAYGLQNDDPANLYLGIVLVVVNSITGVVTYFQNAKSEAIMDAFKNFIPPETLVIRDGQQIKMPASDLVPGDVVIIEFGKRIPADVRITESNEMKVDNSSLTGESALQLRLPECSHPNNPLETKNLAFFGTLCKEGHGKGVVIFTGDRTVIGQIANLVDSATAGETPLRQELNQFIKSIFILSLLIGLLFFILGFILEYDIITNVVFAIGIIVANVPEGLLATVTVALTLTAKKLASKKVLVKNLEGVETLGSTSCICSDKTGTLTQNKMTVENLWYNGKKLRAHNRQKMGPDFKYEYNINEIGFKTLHEVAMMCSEATFDSNVPQETVMKIQNNVGLNAAQKLQKMEQTTKQWNDNLSKLPWQEYPTIGDASETALIKFFQPIENIVTTRARQEVAKDKNHKAAKMPFNSTNKFAFVIMRYETPDSHYCLMSKGAPERIWGLCEELYNEGKIEPKTPEWEKQFIKVNESFGKQGERVLGFAKLHLPKGDFPIGYPFNLDQMNFHFNKQVFAGLISLIDPPKDNVPMAVIKCKTAGIQVIMVTGDQPATAAAIARQCNIITDKTANEIAEEQNISFEEAARLSNAIVIHGDRLTKMAIDEEGLPESDKGRLLNEWLSKPQIVFARTSPAQKLIIVSGCQRRGHIVAVTGDGVNDSPAIKKADIGIAMGITGSDVAKDAADMILLNDDFSNIVIGIEEGRRIFDNLKKTCSYVLTSNIPELLPFLIYIILQIPLPLTTVLILCIDLGTDLVPSTAYVFEEAELDIMTRKPRTKDDHLVGGKLIYFAYIQNGVIQTFGGFLQWMIVLNDFGFPATELINLSTTKGIVPKINDVFDASDPWFGNSNLKEKYTERMAKDSSICIPEDEDNFIIIDWIYSAQSEHDLRMMLLTCNNGRWEQAVQWGECYVSQISPVSRKPVCYTTEASNYAQTSFLFSAVFLQFANYQSLKSLKMSGLFQGMNNPIVLFGYTSELLLIIALSYVEGLNLVFGTRDVLFIHFGVCCLPFGAVMIFWNEFRKYMIRNSKSAVPTMPSWWVRCVAF